VPHLSELRAQSFHCCGTDRADAGLDHIRPVRRALYGLSAAAGNARSGSTTNSDWALFGRRTAWRRSRSWTTPRKDPTIAKKRRPCILARFCGRSSWFHGKYRRALVPTPAVCLVHGSNGLPANRPALPLTRRLGTPTRAARRQGFGSIRKKRRSPSGRKARSRQDSRLHRDRQHDRTRVKFAGSTGPQPPNLERTFSVDRRRLRADFRQGFAYPTVTSRRWVTNHEPLLEFGRPRPVAIRAR